MSNINIARRFDNLSTAILALESEGKLDLTYNRPLALQDAEFHDAPFVFADDADQLWYVSSHEGERILHKYSPFGSILSSGPLNLFFLADRNTILDLKSSIRNDRKSRREVASILGGKVLISSAH